MEKGEVIAFELPREKCPCCNYEGQVEKEEDEALEAQEKKDEAARQVSNHGQWGVGWL